MSKDKLSGTEKRVFALLLQILFPVYILVSTIYLAWRIDISTKWHTWYAYPLVILEAYGVISTFLYLLTSRNITYPKWTPPIGDEIVDVFIPTYNEPEEIVKMTAIGALAIKGVRDVYILDDGNRRKIRILAQNLGTKYIARKENTHAKAGNLNNALSHTDAEFILCLDCDHVPLQSFLTRTLGYFRDKKLAFIQTPQSFYNVDSVQFRKVGKKETWNEQTMFYESIQPTKNIYNSAFFCGSGALLRRASLDTIGGFATGTVTEDIHTSIRLHSKGWKSTYINEPLAFGIAPDDLNEYHKQRVRWGAGSIHLLFRSKESPFLIKGLTPMQRVCYFNSMIGPVNGVMKAFYVVLPAIILATIPYQHDLSRINAVSYFAIFIPFYLFSYVISFLYSRGTFHPLHSEQFNVANILANVIALINGFMNKTKFRVSIKAHQTRQESSPYRLMLCIWAITFISEVAGLNYWYLTIGNTSQQLIVSLTGISLFWNSVNLIFLSSVIWSFNSHSEKSYSDNVIESSVKATLIPIMLPVVIKRIGLKGIDVISSMKLDEDTTTVSIPLIGKKAIVLNAEVMSSSKIARNEYMSKITFSEMSQTLERRLVLYIFNVIVPKTDKYRISQGNVLERSAL